MRERGERVKKKNFFKIKLLENLKKIINVNIL